MLRKRERFERTDVPRATPLRTVVSVLVLVGVVVGMYALITTLWRRANQVSGFGDRALRTAVRSQAATGTVEGYVASGHDYINVLVLTAQGGALTQARLLSLDTTDHKGVLATLPLDTRVVSGEVPLPLSMVFASEGASACVAPVAAATNVSVRHVMVAGDDIWEQLGQLRGVGITNLLGSAADLLETINTDLSTSELFALVETAQGIGVDNLSRIDAPARPDQLEDGTPVSVIDQTQLGLQLGTIVPLAPAEEAPAEEAPAEGEG